MSGSRAAEYIKAMRLATANIKEAAEDVPEDSFGGENDDLTVED